jgi:hypothetical protein
MSRSRQFPDSDVGDPFLARTNPRPHSPTHTRRQRSLGSPGEAAAGLGPHSGDADDDRLAPLVGSRTARRRLDSLSSVGSSLAPGQLPALAATAGARPSSRRRTRERDAEPSSSAAPGASSAGLEGWLRSQSIAVPAEYVASAAPNGRISRRGPGSDAGSDVRSVGAWSAGPRSGAGGSSARRRNGSGRTGLPEWPDAEDMPTLSHGDEERTPRLERRQKGASVGGITRREGLPKASMLTPSTSAAGSAFQPSPSRGREELTPSKARTTFAPLPVLPGISSRMLPGAAALGTSSQRRRERTDSPLRRWVRFMLREADGQGDWVMSVVIALAAVWVRAAVGLGGWSGESLAVVPSPSEAHSCRERTRQATITRRP